MPMADIYYLKPQSYFSMHVCFHKIFSRFYCFGNVNLGRIFCENTADYAEAAGGGEKEAAG